MCIVYVTSYKYITYNHRQLEFFSLALAFTIVPANLFSYGFFWFKLVCETRLIIVCYLLYSKH